MAMLARLSAWPVLSALSGTLALAGAALAATGPAPAIATCALCCTAGWISGLDVVIFKTSRFGQIAATALMSASQFVN